MKRPHLIFTALALSMALTAAAHAETAVSRFVVRGSGADITAESSDECSSTIFFVSGQENVLREGGPSTPQKAAFMSYWTFDWCAGTTTTGAGSVWGPDVDFSANFQGASLSATFTVENSSYPDDPAGEYREWTSTATIKVTWAGTGRVVPDSYHSNVKIGALVWTSHSSYQVRPADVLLDASVDGSPAIFDSVSGALGQVTWGNVMVRRSP